MNKISLGILSDTHLSDCSSATEVASQLLQGPFRDVDVILHAGDMVIAEFEWGFSDIPFYAVQGNMDVARVNLPVKRILEFSGYRVGLIHGWGSPPDVPQNVFNEFKHDDLDLLIFGHSHIPYQRRIEETLLFNPGSAMDHRGNAKTCSVGLVELGRSIRARHLPFIVVL